MLRQEERYADQEGGGDEQGIERALGQCELVVGPEPFTAHEMLGQLEEVLIIGAADGIDALAAGEPELERGEGHRDRQPDPVPM